MGIVIEIKSKPFLKRWKHKIFECPTFWKSKWNTFWKSKSMYRCPKCNKAMHCYWDGNDITNHGIDICGSCASKL